MRPSSVRYPGPEWSQGSSSQSQSSHSSPDPLSIQHDLASPREGPQRPKPCTKRPQILEPSGKDLDYNRLRSQHSLFIDPTPTEPQLSLPILQEAQLSVEGGISGTEKESRKPPPSLRANSESGNQPEFQALISRPDDIQSVENIYAEGFNFSANNLRQITDSKTKGHRSEKQTRDNAPSSQIVHSFQDMAKSGVASHSPLQEGKQSGISGHQDVEQLGEKTLEISAGIPQDFPLPAPNQSNCAHSKGDQAEFRGPRLPDPAYPSADNKPANEHEFRHATLAKSPSNTNTPIDNGQVKRKRSRLEVAQNSKVSARPIEHRGLKPTLDDPREVPAKTNQPGQHHALGILPECLSPGHSGEDQVPPEDSLSQANSYHSPPSDPSVFLATKNGSVIKQETSNKKRGVPFPGPQYPHSTGEQRMGGSINARDQSQAPFHNSPMPELNLQQAPTSGSRSRPVKSQKRIPDAIPDLTFTHSAHDAETPAKESPAGSTKCLIDDTSHGTRRGLARGIPEEEHSSHKYRTEQHAKRERTSAIWTQPQQSTAMKSEPMHPMPLRIQEEACDGDHHLHSSPPNISKRRDHRHEIVRRRKVNTTPGTPGLKSGLNAIAGDFNSFFENFVGYEKHMMSKLSGFKQHIASQNRKIAGFQDNIKGMGQEIASSREKIESQEAQLRDMTAEKEAAEAKSEILERQLAGSNTKAESLRERCQRMKNRFNEGLAEQQKFYVKNKEQCDKVLNSAQQEKRAREQTIEDVSRACEETRLGFQKRLDAVKIEAFKRSALLKKDVSFLRNQLEARQRELDQENEETNRLQKELDQAHHVNADMMRTLMSQNAKILQMMEAHQTQTQAACHSNDSQNEKLEEIAKALREAKSGVLNPATFLEEMKSRDKNLMATVVANIGQMIPSQPFTASDKEKLSREIDFIHKTCDDIWSQFRDDKNAEETQQRYYDAQWRLGDVAEELARVKSELGVAMQWNSEKVEENNRLSLETQNLRGQVEHLQKTVNTLQDASQEADQVSNEQAEKQEASLEALQRENDKAKQASNQEMQDMKKALQEKEENVKLAEEKWKTAEERLDVLRATFQQKEARWKSEQRAFEEGMKEAKLFREIREQELEESVEATAELQSSLIEARDKIQRMSSDRQTTDAEFEKLQNLVGDGAKTANELKAEIQNSQKTQTFLTECLVKWTRDRNKLQSLKTWESEATEKVEEGPEANVLRPSSSKSTDLEPLNVREADRHVTLRSPQDNDPKATPLSVMQERDARRQLDPPKSIMRVTRQTSKRLEATKQIGTAEMLHFLPNADIGRPMGNVEDRAQNQAGASALPRRQVVSTYSSYNRPVEGNASRASEKKRSMAQYNQDAGLEGAISDRGEAKRPKDGSKTSCSVSQHTLQTADARMAEVEFETAEVTGQTRKASDDIADRRTSAVPSTRGQRTRQQPGSDKDQRGYDASRSQDQVDIQASTQTTKASSENPDQKTKADSQTSITSSKTHKRRRV